MPEKSVCHRCNSEVTFTPEKIFGLPFGTLARLALTAAEIIYRRAYRPLLGGS
jgi:hypothetical protein